LLTVKQFSV